MLDQNLLLMLLAGHFGIILLYFLIFLMTKRTCFRREHIVPIIGIPVFGLLIGLGIQWVYWAKHSGGKSVDMETVRLGSNIYWRSIQKPQDNPDIVPLEEAINLDSYGVRRRILLDALFEEPEKHIQVLKVASHNVDPETAHYAATAIDKIHRDFQMEIQRYAAELIKYPDNQQFLNDYIRLVEKYIESGLVENHLAVRQRRILAKLLDRKLSNNPNDKQVLIKKLRNNLALKEYGSCLEISKLLRLGWPNDEDTWIESLRVSVETKDTNTFREVLDGIQRSDIDWSKSSRNKLKVWIEGLSY